MKRIRVIGMALVALALVGCEAVAPEQIPMQGNTLAQHNAIFRKAVIKNLNVLHIRQLPAGTTCSVPVEYNGIGLVDNVLPGEGDLVFCREIESAISKVVLFQQIPALPGSEIDAEEQGATLIYDFSL